MQTVKQERVYGNKLHNGCTMIKIEQNIIVSQVVHIFFTSLPRNKLLSGKQIEEPEQRGKNFLKDTSQCQPKINNNYKFYNCYNYYNYSINIYNHNLVRQDKIYFGTLMYCDNRVKDFFKLLYSFDSNF